MTMAHARYRLARLPNGASSIHSLETGETCHPGIGPEAEAEALYVPHLKLLEQTRRAGEELVIWDVGLGAAANALTVLRAVRTLDCAVTVFSFDRTLEMLEFALENTGALPYLRDFTAQLKKLLIDRSISFAQGHQPVGWNLNLGEFDRFLKEPAAARLPKPHAILFDPFSPARNPEMWTQGLFSDLFGLLDPHRPCVMPTYSRSTFLRVSLLLAGFYVGRGPASGRKEETTVAANAAELISEPLDRRWLDRVRRSPAAEPLWEAVYRQAPLSEESWEKLLAHPQFRNAEGAGGQVVRSCRGTEHAD